MHHEGAADRIDAHLLTSDRVADEPESECVLLGDGALAGADAAATLSAGSRRRRLVPAPSQL